MSSNMNELQKEIKRSVLAAQKSGNKFADDPLWESQAWFLRTRLKFGNDYQQFWDHTQGQINDYVTNLNSEDQIKARAEVAESFTLALKTGFDDCNKQMDLLLQKVFDPKKIEDDKGSDSPSSKQEPEIINLIDVEDNSVNQRVQVDPPSKFDKVKKKKADPEPTNTLVGENHTVTSSIVAVLEESVTEDEEETSSEIIDVATNEDVNDIPNQGPRNDRLEVANPHRTIEPELTNLAEEPLDAIEESPEVIDLTYEQEEIGEVVDVEEFEEFGESGHDSRDDDEPTPGPIIKRTLSLSDILLGSYNEETKDSPARAKWYDDSVLATIVSRDTMESEYEPLEIKPSKSREILSAVGKALFGASNSKAPKSDDVVNEGREGADDSEQRCIESGNGAEGSRMEPIDLTQV